MLKCLRLQILAAKSLMGAKNPSLDWRKNSMESTIRVGLVAVQNIAHGRELEMVMSSDDDLGRLCHSLLPPQTQEQAEAQAAAQAAQQEGDPNDPPMAIGNCVVVVDRERMTIKVTLIKGVVAGDPVLAWHVHDVADGVPPQWKAICDVKVWM